jgi:hypothetical protein
MTDLIKYLLLGLLVAYCSSAAAITFGELDNFSSTLEGWSQGESPTGSAGVSRLTSGGPSGTGDAYMRIAADAASAHGRLVAFNRTSGWTGNYVTAGVTGLSMTVNNLGQTDLDLRLAFGTTAAPDSGGSWLSSSLPISLPAGSGWTSVQFPIGSSAMTRVQGTASYTSIMSAVSTLRLLHSTAPNNRGGVITGSLGVDNIMALGASAVTGDFDGNGTVNGADLARWRLDFPAATTSDADRDGDSDGNDLLVWQRQLGATQASPVPEPNLLLALACAVAWLAQNRNYNRRRRIHGRSLRDRESAVL